MPRPPIPRLVRQFPGAVYYKPRGVPLRLLDETVVGLDEVEALRLADMEGLAHEEVGRRMNVSRATAGRILARARAKVAEALVTGKALRLEGGAFRVPPGAVPPFTPGAPTPFPGAPAVGPPGTGTGRGRGGR